MLRSCTVARDRDRWLLGLQHTHAHTHTHTHVHTHTHTHTHTHVNTHARTRAHTHIHTDTRMQTQIYSHMKKNGSISVESLHKTNKFRSTLECPLPHRPLNYLRTVLI